MFELRSIKFAFGLAVLFICLFSLYTLQQRTMTTPDTASTKWKLKNYAQPPPDILAAIDRNTITERMQGQKKPLNILLIAVVNTGMMNYTLNWIESLKRTGQDDKYLVFAIDQGVVDIMTERGYEQHVTLIPADWFHRPLDSGFARWKSNSYLPITHAKTLVVERLLYFDMTVWFTDVDIVFLSPHIRATMLAQMGGRDMVFSQEIDQRVINSGFYMMRPTSASKRLMGLVVQGQDDTQVLTQQKVMNRVLRSAFTRDFMKCPYRFLDMLLFPNGCDYFRKNLPNKLGIQPLMLHANCLIGDKKKDALAKEGMWLDVPKSGRWYCKQ